MRNHRLPRVELAPWLGDRLNLKTPKKQDDDNEQTDSDNDGDDFVHPKFSTHDDEAKQNEEVNEEDSFDPRVTNSPFSWDVNVNLEGRDTEMTDAPSTIVQTTQVIEDTHVIITPVNPEDVLVTAIAEPSLLSITTLPPPPTPLITHLYQAPVRTPATVTSSFLQDLPNFGPLFGTKSNNKLRHKSPRFWPKIEKSVNEQLEAEVMTCSSTEYKTSHDVAANLSELELKKILIDKMESNKSIHRSDEQKNLYKALV
ncbi:hypothetical protein Tco_0732469 [Tanacetum coccineum]